MFIKREEQYILIVVLGLYLLNKYCLCKFSTNYFMRCYFNDVMGGIVFGIMIRIANRFWFKREITFWLYELLFVIAGIYWECIAPLYIEYSVGDAGDIAAYFGSGLCLLLILEILGGRKMKCKKCGEEICATIRFCPKCGEKIEHKQYCTECGAELPLSAEFCSSCGTPVTRKKVERKKESDVSDSNEVFINDNKIEESIMTAPRTKETFSEELKQLAQQDKGSKAVLEYYGEKVLIKFIHPLLNHGEKVVGIRHIVHHNYANTFMRGGILNTKEFLLITNERIIKFVKSFWLKPKIKSCYFSQINSIEDAKSGGYLHGIFVGEKLKINSTKGLITIRTWGRGSAYQVKSDILRAVSENQSGNFPMENETNHSVYEQKRKWGIKGVIAGCAVTCIVGVVLLFLWAGRAIELSDYILLPKDDIMKFISEQELIDENDIGIYHKDGLSIMLTEQGTIYSISVQSPEYKLCGITVGDEFIDSEDGEKLLDYGFRFLDKLEGVKEKRLYYGSLREGKTDNEQMIEIKTDENNKVIEVAYGRNDTETFAELGIELDNDDSIGEDENKESNVNKGIFIPGTYSAEVRGLKVMTVTTTFTKDRIVDIQVKHEETESIGGQAIDLIKSQILESQTLNIDAVSGATLTSNAIVDGVAECVKQAGVDIRVLKENVNDVSSVSESNVKSLVKQYEGEWWDLNSQRCYMNIKAAGGNKLSIIVSWSSGYANDSKWEMTGQINGVNGKIIYNDCTQYDLDYNKNDAEQRTINYTNGSGYFYLGNDGYLYWEDEMEYAGAGCYFEKDRGSTETQDTTNYTANVPLGSGTTMYVVQCKASITLRNAPSSNAAEITQIPLYASVEYFGTLDNGFAQVAYNGQVGYVFSSYLDYYEPQAYTGIKCQIVNCRQSVTLRTSITAQDKEICQIPLGTVIDYIDEGANGYCLVNYNGVMGYVNQDYLLFFSE